MTEKANNQRLIVVSDSVIAVAVTLLVLDVRLPVEDAGSLTDAALWLAILATLPRIYAYLLSFVVVALFWSSHHQKFALIPRVDGVIAGLNIVFLLLIGLVPFVTAILAENLGVVATVAYAGVMTALAATVMLIWSYASATDRLRRDLEAGRRRRIFWLSVGTFAIFLASIPMAFLNPAAARYLWLLLAPISIARYVTHRNDAAGEGAS